MEVVYIKVLKLVILFMVVMIMLTGCILSDIVDTIFPEDVEELEEYIPEGIEEKIDTSNLETDEEIFANKQDIKKTSVKIKLNDKYLKEDYEGEEIYVPTIYLKDRLLIPLQSLRDELDMTLDWKAGGIRPEIAVRYKNTIIKLISGTNKFYITLVGDGIKEEKVVLATTPNIEFEGRFYVPVRFISENFNIKVEWKNDLNEVHLTTND